MFDGEHLEAGVIKTVRWTSGPASICFTITGEWLSIHSYCYFVQERKKIV
jgi:hypothetical protein